MRRKNCKSWWGFSEMARTGRSFCWSGPAEDARRAGFCRRVGITARRQMEDEAPRNYEIAVTVERDGNGKVVALNLSHDLGRYVRMQGRIRRVSIM
jgi:hypothetical protein